METQDENKQTLGDYCKSLELMYTQGIGCMDGNPAVLIPETQYCIIRVDGRAFHTFTRPYKSKTDPFCPDIINAMKAAVDALINEFSPVVVYTQSDEITVIIEPHKVPFGRRCHKLNSIAASVATAAFNGYLYRNSLNRTDKPATFDARSYGADRKDVLKVLIWRQKDAIKNSISAVARTVFSHKVLESKNSDERMAMLVNKGVDWNTYPYGCKYGLTAFRVVREVTIDTEFLRKNNVPEHVIEQITGEGGKAMRNVTEYPELPKFTDIANLDAVIFEHADPLYTTSAAMAALNKETPNED